MFKELKETMSQELKYENDVHQIENISKEIEFIRQNQIEISQLESAFH